MNHILVALGARSYPIFIGEGVLGDAEQILGEASAGRHIVLIADAAVDGLYGDSLTNALTPLCPRIDRLTIAGGEGAKSLESYGKLMEEILNLGVERTTLIIALGGGVIGDLVGFVAATLLRGVEYIQIPTTLLAMVDSAVGGKVGINAPLKKNLSGKNLIGAFHQPKAVLADTQCLATLPKREMLAGYAEVVKYGLLGDAEFFGFLEKNHQAILGLNSQELIDTISRCCAMKAEIVADDEREGGRRALLNLGHTFAHAYEAEAGYDGSVLHGEAVAVGMVNAFHLATSLGVSPEADLTRVKTHLKTVGLPHHRTQLSEHLGQAKAETLLAHMHRDKKTIDGKITLILPHGIGTARIERGVDPKAICGILNDKGDGD